MCIYNKWLRINCTQINQQFCSIKHEAVSIVLTIITPCHVCFNGNFENAIGTFSTVIIYYDVYE